MNSKENRPPTNKNGNVQQEEDEGRVTAGLKKTPVVATDEFN
jgi:hypothetical protein